MGLTELSILVFTVYKIVWTIHVVGSSPTRGSSFFLGKVTALGVLCCFAWFVCLTLLASFFLPSHLLLKTCTYMYVIVNVTDCTYTIFVQSIFMYLALS